MGCFSIMARPIILLYLIFRVRASALTVTRHSFRLPGTYPQSWERGPLATAILWYRTYKGYRCRVCYHLLKKRDFNVVFWWPGIPIESNDSRVRRFGSPVGPSGSGRGSRRPPGSTDLDRWTPACGKCSSMSCITCPNVGRSLGTCAQHCRIKAGRKPHPPLIAAFSSSCRNGGRLPDPTSESTVMDTGACTSSHGHRVLMISKSTIP